MHTFFSFLSSAWAFLCEFAATFEGYDGECDDDQGYARRSRDDDDQGYEPEAVCFMPPAEHNAWGSVADYTFASSDD